jgi:hypothetical protein
MKFGVRDGEFSDFFEEDQKNHEFLQSNPNLDHRISKYLGLRWSKFGFASVGSVNISFYGINPNR